MTGPDKNSLTATSVSNGGGAIRKTSQTERPSQAQPTLTLGFSAYCTDGAGGWETLFYWVGLDEDGWLRGWVKAEDGRTLGKLEYKKEP